MPELQDEVISAAQAKANSKGENDQDSKYVQMEPIKKPSKVEEDMEEHSSLDDTSKVKKIRSRNLVFKNVELASTRLVKFSNFCQNFKPILNKIVKKMYSARSGEKEALAREMVTVHEYIKFMPSVMDFENKRLYFKKEVKKMRRAAYSRTLTLNIRRSEIFMDAYSNLGHLNADELK